MFQKIETPLQQISAKRLLPIPTQKFCMTTFILQVLKWISKIFECNNHQTLTGNGERTKGDLAFVIWLNNTMINIWDTLQDFVC